MPAPRPLVVCFALAAALVAATAAAAPHAETNQELFDAAKAHLEAGAPTRAIDNLELLADRGVSSPDASFNRGLAYVARAESQAVRPGDLGRAAAAFAETLALAPDDDAASLMLEQVREEIARRRARRGGEPIAVSAGLGWALVGLASENAWAIGAAVGSALLTLGLGLILLGRSRPLRVAAVLLIGVGALQMFAFGGLALAARQRRIGHTPAIVVAPEARLTDAAGRKRSDESRGHDVVVEGAEIDVLERRGQRAYVEWDGARGWIGTEAMRLLPKR